MGLLCAGEHSKHTNLLLPKRASRQQSAAGVLLQGLWEVGETADWQVLSPADESKQPSGLDTEIEGSWVQGAQKQTTLTKPAESLMEVFFFKDKIYD